MYGGVTGKAGDRLPMSIALNKPDEQRARRAGIFLARPGSRGGGRRSVQIGPPQPAVLLVHNGLASTALALRMFPNNDGCLGLP